MLVGCCFVFVCLFLFYFWFKKGSEVFLVFGGERERNYIFLWLIKFLEIDELLILIRIMISIIICSDLFVIFFFRYFKIRFEIKVKF